MMFDLEQGSCVVDAAVAVAVIADGAVEEVILENSIESVKLGIFRASRLGNDLYRASDDDGAGAD